MKNAFNLLNAIYPNAECIFSRSKLDCQFYFGESVMGTNNNYNGLERRFKNRRSSEDRRETTRFNDALGRRSGVERRLPLVR